MTTLPRSDAATPDAARAATSPGAARDATPDAARDDARTTPPATAPNPWLMFVVYLCGLLLGGLYVGMAAPARTVVQESFGIDSSTGIWMINIYTLLYASLIPVIGRVADMRGRNRIYTVCLGVFALGSVFSGLSQIAGAFPLLLVGRALEAAGAAGMIPVANAEIGVSFPEDKRGTALGIAAATSGLANVMGSGVGSLVLGLTGTERWGLMFWGAVPVCLLVMVAARVILPPSTVDPESAHGTIDLAGAVVFVAFVVLVLLGLKNVDFFDVVSSIVSPWTWVPLVLAVLCLPLFGIIERRAQSPIFHLEYFGNRGVVVTMVVSFFIGCSIISMTLIPECAEYILGLEAGSGGFYMMSVGVFGIVGPIVGGKIIDRVGPKPTLMCGLAAMAAGYLFLALVGAPVANAALLVAGLCLVGLGMGFAMGAPTNYMVLESTTQDQATSAVATIALVRQLGTSIAPTVFVGFTSAGLGLLGYQMMLSAVAVCGLAGLVAAAFYRTGE